MIKRKAILVTTVVVVVVLFTGATLKASEQEQVHSKNGAHSSQQRLHSRHLLFNHFNCSPAAIEDFPTDAFSQSERLHGYVTLHFIAALYMFLALALVCDEYFVPSLEVICSKLKIPDDVAGATFMAAGSSAPELATTIIGVFVAKNDVGLGAIVGSAVFNVLFVPAVCALAAGMIVYLSWWPLLRDSICYAITITALALVIFDGLVFWYEALIIVGLYAAYIILMRYNQIIERQATRLCYCIKIPSQWYDQQKLSANSDTGDNHNAFALDNGAFMILDEGMREPIRPARCHKRESTSSTDKQETLTDVNPFGEGASNPVAISPELQREVTMVTEESQVNTDHQRQRALDVFSLPDGFFKRFIYFLGLPLSTIMFITVPDCRVPRFRKLYWLTFLMSTVWIGAFAYIMVWMIVVIGSTLRIPDSLMGVTFVAFGASVPDLISSYIVVKDGKGDMAISNAVGSNVFDILVCLGVPWLFRTLIDADARANGIVVYSTGLLYSTLTLLGTVLLFLTVNGLNKWKMDKKYGLILMAMYVVFMVFASLYELNVFGYVNPPECVSAGLL